MLDYLNLSDVKDCLTNLSNFEGCDMSSGLSTAAIGAATLIGMAALGTGLTYLYNSCTQPQSAPNGDSPLDRVKKHNAGYDRSKNGGEGIAKKLI